MALRVAAFLAAFLVLCGATVLFPGIDLAVGRMFFVEGHGFAMGDAWPFRLVRAAMPLLVIAIVLAGAALVVFGRREKWHGLDWRAGALLLAALAIGPGFVVNVIFKDHWGRARPAEIAQFGGTARFTPAFVPSDQCGKNCSFPAGDPANGFVLVAAALLIPGRRTRNAAIAGAVILGAMIGIVRIGQGGHFFSDVLATGFLVTAIAWALHRWIVVADGLPKLGQALAHPPTALRCLVVWFGVTALAIEASYAWLDRPLARSFANEGPATRALFRFITTFGYSTGYLVVSALIAIGLGWIAWRAVDGVVERWCTRQAWRAGFVFAAVGGAGLLGDILKPVFGRARPRLYVADGTFGFTWHGAHAVYWSFPSGHAITIVALSAALTMLDRRVLPWGIAASLLVMLSRLALEEHYLSDVIAGAFLALVFTWALAAALRRAGVTLTDSP